MGKAWIWFDVPLFSVGPIPDHLRAHTANPVPAQLQLPQVHCRTPDLQCWTLHLYVQRLLCGQLQEGGGCPGQAGGEKGVGSDVSWRYLKLCTLIFMVLPYPWYPSLLHPQIPAHIPMLPSQATSHILPLGIHRSRWILYNL